MHIRLGLALAAALCSFLAAAPGRAHAATEPAVETPPCPEEQLSCGLQKPVVSDGQVFQNEEMGIQATFPAGSQVCMSRSGDAPRGFYAWYGVTIKLCEGDERPPAYVGIGSSFNPLDYRSLRKLGNPCRSMSPEVKRALRGRRLAIPGHPSRLCQSRDEEGRISLTLHAMAGEREGDDIPVYLYWASLGSRPERLEQDLVMFQAFLDKLRIGLDLPLPE